MPDERTSGSQAGVPGVRAAFISPNRKEPSALLVTSLLTVRGGSQSNGKYAVTASRSTSPRRAARDTTANPRARPDPRLFTTFEHNLLLYPTFLLSQRGDKENRWPPDKPVVLGHGLGDAPLKVLPASWPNGPVQAPLCLSPEELHLSPADTSPVQFAMLNGLSALPWFQT